MAKASTMRPDKGRGAVRDAKAEPSQRQAYGKRASKHPPRKPGTSGDGPRSRKGSPLSGKK